MTSQLSERFPKASEMVAERFQKKPSTETVPLDSLVPGDLFKVNGLELGEVVRVRPNRSIVFRVAGGATGVRYCSSVERLIRTDGAS